MSAAGIIFSNIHDINFPQLTRSRTVASVPFGCRYRFIDFALSNMVNSNIYNISVITHYNYHSLMDHIGSGKDWDLARRTDGVKILPPYITAYANNSNGLYSTRLEALKSINYSISRMTEDYVVLSDCNVVCNIDLNDIISDHIKSGSDATFAVKNAYISEETSEISAIYKSDDENLVTDVLAYPKTYKGNADISLNIMVFNREYLQSMILDSIAHNYTSLVRDIILKNIGKSKFSVYKYDGYFARVTSFSDYYRYNMELISNPDARDSLFGVKNRPIYTKVRNSTPTYYHEDSAVKDSLIADGCQILGTVENSILFRGVKVGKNATVKNSILMQDAYVGDGAYLNCVISDKNTLVRDGRMLWGAEEEPYYIDKGKSL